MILPTKFQRRNRKRKRNKTNDIDYCLLQKRELLATFAPINGFGNNVANPEFGTTDVQALRLSDNVLESVNGFARPDAPNPRFLSNALSAQDEAIDNERFLSSFWFTVGQSIVDHDVTRFFNAPGFEFSPFGGESANITVPEGDQTFEPGTELTFNRRPFSSEDRTGDNRITAFLDASFVYGSDADTANFLRTGVDGKLKTSPGDFLPLSDGSVRNLPPFPGVQIAGDIRSGENVPLTAIHTLFLREHNRIAEELISEGLTADEEIYQQAREKVMGLVQSVIYNEFLPSMLGFNAIDEHTGYDPTIDPGITHEFADVVFRIGHTTVPSEIEINGEVVPFENLFNDPGFVEEVGLEAIFEGLANTPLQRVDPHVINGLRNALADGPPGAQLDLVATNLKRSRDTGIGGINDIREAIGLETYNSIFDLTQDSELAQKLIDAYGTTDVNAIDPWMAMVSEQHVPGAGLGETMRTIFIDQFTRMRDGDRFFYKHNENLTEAEIEEIDGTRLSDIIRRNTENIDIQDELMWLPNVLVFSNPAQVVWNVTDLGNGIRVQAGDAIVNRPDADVLIVAPLPGEGRDIFNIIANNLQFVEIYGEDGRDRIKVRAEIDSFFADGNDGRDFIKVVNNQEGAIIEVTGGDDADRIKVRALEAEMILALGGNGNDRIRVKAGEDTNTENVLGEAGRDSVRIREISPQPEVESRVNQNNHCGWRYYWYWLRQRGWSWWRR